MNKEVIYLEPEDDITDILTKLQRAEQKLVALVPPKKATMLRSAVNMKLVARAAKECKKIVVIVTADPAISKMAMLAQIPVAKTLQSRPVVPTKESIAAAQASEQVIDEDLADVTDQKDSAKTPGEGSESASEKTSTKSADTFDLSEESLENGSKDAKKADQKGKKVPNMSKARKWIIFGSIAAVIAVVVGVWALVFAPAVSIVVAMNTSSNNFSEEVRFTSEASKEDIDAGVFYLDKQTLSEKYTTDFTATGEEDQGEKAKGEVTVTYRVQYGNFIEDEGFAIGVSSGDLFTTAEGLQYRATATDSIKWNGENNSELRTICDSVSGGTCVKAFTIPVEAIKAGEDYNISKGTTWNIYEDIVNATVTNSDAFTGGTTKMVKTVTQSDVDKVKEDQVSEHTAEGRSSLFDDLSKDLVIIEASFTAEAGDVTSTPAINDTVGDNTTPNATVNVNFSVYTVDKAKIDQYIKAKMNIGEDQKIYSIGEPYFDRFTSAEEPARLKTVVKTGPTVTEEDILERSKGRKIGEIQSLLRSINGVSSVEITPSFFWVRTVPNDDSKITIDLTVEDK